jgi:hypothetical protein
VVLDGRVSDTLIDGTDLEAQFACDHGYLLWTTYDVPYEELLHVTLVSADLHILDKVELGASYTPGILSNLAITAPDSIGFSLVGGDRWTLKIQPNRRLKLLRDRSK